MKSLLFSLIILTGTLGLSSQAMAEQRLQDSNVDGTLLGAIGGGLATLAFGGKGGYGAAAGAVLGWSADNANNDYRPEDEVYRIRRRDGYIEGNRLYSGTKTYEPIIIEEIITTTTVTTYGGFRD